jgi:hypothetical protein
MDTERWLKWIPAIGALLVALILLAIFIFRQVPNDWSSVVALVVIAIFIFVVAVTLHFAIRDPVEWFTDNEARLRGKLAPLVVGIGTVGILVVAGGVTWGITTQSPDGTVDPSVYLGILSTVVPVFATWVGAVIAFFFSNESFRQAAIAAGATSGSSSDAEPVTSPARMISVEKITSITLGGPKPLAASKAADTNAPAAHPTAAPQLYPARFEDVLLVDVANLLGNTVTRVVVFEKHRAVKAVLRGRLIPAHVAGDTVQKYLDHEGNRSDAFNFSMLPETATIGDARAMARVFKLADIFITKTGQKDEPIKGWLPDDRLL